MREYAGGTGKAQVSAAEKQSLSPWSLPDALYFGGRAHEINGDYRDILEIFSYFQDPDLPDFLKWQIALGLFYKESIPRKLQVQAAEAMTEFLNCGSAEDNAPVRPLLDWQQDAPLIAADINKTAGLEIRALPFLHWWTFLGYFQAIGEGQLSAVVGIREKLRRGQKLTDWEQTYYREHPGRIRMRQHLSREEKAEREQLQALLDRKAGD